MAFLTNSFHQEEFHGFTDLDVASASEKADSLRKEGDLLKHDLAEARAHKVGTKTFSRRKNIFPFFFTGKIFLPSASSIAQSCIFQFLSCRHNIRKDGLCTFCILHSASHENVSKWRLLPRDPRPHNCPAKTKKDARMRQPW